MSFGNLFFLDDEWRELLAKTRDMEQSSVDKHLLELAVEGHLRKHIGEQMDIADLQKPFIKEYKSQIKKALPTVTTAELKKIVATHVNAVDGLARSLVDRSFKIMDVFIGQLEKSLLELVEERLSDAVLDPKINAKINVKMGQFPIKKEKKIRDAIGSPIIHHSDLIRYFSKKKSNNGYER